MAFSDVPTFLGYASPDGSWVLDFPAQAKAWVRSIAKDTGAELEVRITERGQDKTRAQEKGFHAMIAPWARARGSSLTDLKQFLLAEVFSTHEFVGPGGVVFQVLAEPSSARLTKKQYSELIERSMDIAANDSPPFVLIPPDEWRKAREKEARKARKAA